MSENPTPASLEGKWIRRLAKLLMALGGAGFVCAVGWWFVFFEQMLGTDVKTASECFYRTTMECQVGNFVGSFMETAPYEPVFMWSSTAVGVIGFLVYAFTPRT